MNLIYAVYMRLTLITELGLDVIPWRKKPIEILNYHYENMVFVKIL